MVRRYIVDLTEEAHLLELIKKGRASARKITRAHILLLADEGKTDETIAQVLHVGVSTVEHTRKKFVEGDLEYALDERLRPGGRRKLDGKDEAFLIALACSNPSEGRKTWTMQLLADKLEQFEPLLMAGFPLSQPNRRTH